MRVERVAHGKNLIPRGASGNAGPGSKRERPEPRRSRERDAGSRPFGKDRVSARRRSLRPAARALR